MENLTVKVENAEVGNAVALFLENYKEAVSQFVNNVIVGSDAFVEKTAEGEVSIYQFAPDKGNVIGKYEEGDEVQLVKYGSLPIDAKYILLVGDKLTLFLKQPQGKADIKVGQFVNLNDAIVNFDSEGVNLHVEHRKKALENEAKEKAKAEKKIKQKLLKAKLYKAPKTEEKA